MNLKIQRSVLNSSINGSALIFYSLPLVLLFLMDRTVSPVQNGLSLQLFFRKAFKRVVSNEQVIKEKKVLLNMIF